jgi:L-fuculose-phosphate aldolase
MDPARTDFFANRTNSMHDGQSLSLRQQICEVGQRLYQRAYISGSEGNISARLGRNCLCTPTGVSKGFLKPEQIALIDMTGSLLNGPLPATSESPMHTAIYRAQPAAKGVLHAHPPYATALGVAGIEIPTYMLNEGAAFLGEVPLLPFEIPGTAALATQISQTCGTSQAIMMKNHGALTWSDSLEGAWLLMEMLEAVAKITWLARTLGKVDLIPKERLPELPKPKMPAANK